MDDGQRNHGRWSTQSWTMVDAIKKMCLMLPNLHLHRPSRGEAEAFIDASLSRCEDKHGVVIMSNDTDFLVYGHCPGFLSFSSLQFTPSGEESLTLSGFHYVSSNFRRAFFQNRRDVRFLSTVAGLAGCDYDDERLTSARAIIIKSKLGGLRVKHQNKPTTQMTLTAVLRYVSHYVEHPTPWVDALVQSLGDDKLLESLNQVHQTYFPDTRDVEQESSLSVESLRMFEGVFYCRPLIKKYVSTLQPEISIKARRTPNRSKRSRKRQKRKQEAIAHNNDETAEQRLPPAERIDFDDDSSSLDYDDIHELLREQSVWTLPHFLRFRVLLYGLVKSTGQSSATHVLEWRRSGSNQASTTKNSVWSFHLLRSSLPLTTC